MKTIWAMVAAMLCIMESLANAQTPAANLVGTWVAPSAFCGKSIVVVAAVEENGIVWARFFASVRAGGRSWETRSTETQSEVRSGERVS